jgi:hypothetical protein
MRLDREREDRPAKTGGIARRETPKLALGGGRNLDSVVDSAHPSSEP